MHFLLLLISPDKGRDEAFKQVAALEVTVVVDKQVHHQLPVHAAVPVIIIIIIVSIIRVTMIYICNMVNNRCC